jgi:hypothetical protein
MLGNVKDLELTPGTLYIAVLSFKSSDLLQDYLNSTFCLLSARRGLIHFEDVLECHKNVI